MIGCLCVSLLATTFCPTFPPWRFEKEPLIDSYASINKSYLRVQMILTGIELEWWVWHCNDMIRHVTSSQNWAKWRTRFSRTDDKRTWSSEGGTKKKEDGPMCAMWNCQCVNYEGFPPFMQSYQHPTFTPHGQFAPQVCIYLMYLILSHPVLSLPTLSPFPPFPPPPLFLPSHPLPFSSLPTPFPPSPPIPSSPSFFHSILIFVCRPWVPPLPLSSTLVRRPTKCAPCHPIRMQPLVSRNH